MYICEPAAHDGSSENALVNPSPPLRFLSGEGILIAHCFSLIASSLDRQIYFMLQDMST